MIDLELLGKAFIITGSIYATIMWIALVIGWLIRMWKDES